MSQEEAPSIRTFTLVDPETGEFGGVVTGHEADIAPLLIGKTVVEGAFDSATQRLDVATGEVVVAPPRAPMIHELRQERNEMLDAWRWTVMPDSPLSTENQADWLAWLRALQGALRDVSSENTSGFAWPARPALVYAEEGSQ